jgi:hypothetical protein
MKSIKVGDLVTGVNSKGWRGVVTSINNNDVFIYVFSRATWGMTSSGNRNIVMWEDQLTLVDK